MYNSIAILCYLGFTMFMCYLSYQEGYSEGREAALDKSAEDYMLMERTVRSKLEHNHSCNAKRKE